VNEDEQYEMEVTITDAFGQPKYADNAMFYQPDGAGLYRFIAVCKSNDDVYYEGVDEIEEAYEKASNVLYDSAVDSEMGVYMVIAIVDTSDGSIIYPTYTASFANAGRGSLSQYAY
jgi:hypothetical protein